MGIKNEEHFQRKCRLCGRQGRRFTDIFTLNVFPEENKSKPNKKLPQLIYKCLHLQVKEDDGMPKKICDDCNKKLASWQNFYRKCEDTQKKLKHYLENQDKSSAHVPNYTDVRQSNATCSTNNGSSLSTQENNLKVQESTSLTNVKVTESIDATVIKEGKCDTDKGITINNSIKINEDFYKNSNCKVKLKSTSIKKKTLKKDVEGFKEVVQINDTDISQKKELVQKDFSKSKLAVKDEIHECNICHKTFKNKGLLKAHIASHFSSPEFQCDKCSKKFRSKFSLRSHLETHSSSRNYCCHLCGRLFHTASGLCNHVKLHSESKRFTCPLCSKQFRQAGHLEQHQRTHTGERPHKCTECVQRFTTRCQLSRHIQGVHRCEKKHKCVICGKEFLYSTNYKAHLLRHAGQRDNKCGECGKTFVTSNALFRHRRSHTGDKPFQCDICGKKFADCSNRKRHMLRHLQEPIIPKGRKSGPQPKLTRIINVKSVVTSKEEQSVSSQNVNDMQLLKSEDCTKGHLLYISTPPTNFTLESNQTEEKSSQAVSISGELINLCRNNNIEISNLTNIYTSHLPEHLDVNSLNNQQSILQNNCITGSSNLFMNGSQETSQLSVQNSDILVDTTTHEISNLDSVHKKQNIDNCYDEQNNGSIVHMTEILQIENLSGVTCDKSSKSKLSQNLIDSNNGIELDKPKTYTNLRTFLESSEVVETLSDSKADDIEGNDHLMNVEYVTLIAGDESKDNIDSEFQKIIVLPDETRISDFVTNMVKQNELDGTIKKITEKTNKDNSEPAPILKENIFQSHTRNDNNISTMFDKAIQKQNLHTSDINGDNLIQVLLPNNDSNLKTKNGDKVQNETVDTTNLIQVLLESDSNNSLAQLGQIHLVNKTQQTFLISADSLNDEDAIIRMLNSQGTIMLSTAQNDSSYIDLTKSPDDSCVMSTSSDKEWTERNVTESKQRTDLLYKSFSSVNNSEKYKSVEKKATTNNFDLAAASDYEHEVSVRTAISFNNFDENLILRRNLPVDIDLDEKMKRRELQNSEQNDIPIDMEILELCSDEVLTNLTPMTQICQVYHTGKSIENT